MTVSLPRVAVLGGGVIGLTAALVLHNSGYAVTVYAAEVAARTTSGIAGAILVPYHPDTATPQEWDWAQKGITEYTELSRSSPDTAIELHEGSVLFRTSDDASVWLAKLPGARRDMEVAARHGAGAAVTMSVPVIDMPRYLGWLLGRCRALGVQLQLRQVHDVEELLDEADAVVVCPGLAARELLGDESMTAIRGQLVRLRNTIGLDKWLLDDDNSAGVTYIMARGGEILAGGTHEPGKEDLRADPAVGRAILERAISCIPELRHAPVIDFRVGLRPHRPAVRLERDSSDPRIVYNYGHGGSGVTMAWGTALELPRLIGS